MSRLFCHYFSQKKGGVCCLPPLHCHVNSFNETCCLKKKTTKKTCGGLKPADKIYFQP